MNDLVGEARRLSPSAQEALRLPAVAALAALAAGRGREDVAAVFGVSLKAVDIWWAKWQAGGREALVMRPRGKPVGVHQVIPEAFSSDLISLQSGRRRGGACCRR
ncbi:helix-turn-helix domain-containing protein [Streptomyces sp. NPDC048825]|uniref:helix-turn-helix domain-containing protein n=1 Tax=Streptomyces sp. NPDC048825 TaxID=3365592 RepID=UPI0037243A96